MYYDSLITDYIITPVFVSKVIIFFSRAFWEFAPNIVSAISISVKHRQAAKKGVPEKHMN